MTEYTTDPDTLPPYSIECVGHSFHIFQEGPGVWTAALVHDNKTLYLVSGRFTEGPLDVLARLVEEWSRLFDPE